MNAHKLQVQLSSGELMPFESPPDQTLRALVGRKGQLMIQSIEALHDVTYEDGKQKTNVYVLHVMAKGTWDHVINLDIVSPEG